MIIYRLKKFFFPDLEELTEYLVSAAMAVSFKPCIAPSGRTNVYFVYYQFAPMNYHLLQRKHRFSRNQNLDIQRVNENEILCQNYQFSGITRIINLPWIRIFTRVNIFAKLTALIKQSFRVKSAFKSWHHLSNP